MPCSKYFGITTYPAIAMWVAPDRPYGVAEPTTGRLIRVEHIEDFTVLAVGITGFHECCGCKRPHYNATLPAKRKNYDAAFTFQVDCGEISAANLHMVISC